MLITIKVHLWESHRWLAVTNPVTGKQKRTQLHKHTISIWNQNCPLFLKILTETATGETVKGKNCSYVAISFDMGLINSPVFPRHIIIYLICQIWYLTTLSSEQLTYPGKVSLVNHKERWQVSQISSVIKRREAERTSIFTLPGTGNSVN